MDGKEVLDIFLKREKHDYETLTASIRGPLTLGNIRFMKAQQQAYLDSIADKKAALEKVVSRHSMRRTSTEKKRSEVS